MGHLHRFDLNTYITKFGCNTMVETGTGRGGSLSFALMYPFSKLYSIEIMKPLYDYVSNQIKDERVTLLNTNSLVGLENILTSLNSEAIVLFWLDAHFPGVDYFMGTFEDDYEKDIKLPLEAELKLIASHRKKDVFIIDDLNHYEQGPYSFGNLPERYLYFRTKYNLKIDFVYELFGDTHDVHKDYRDQGYFIITPKVVATKNIS